MTNGFHVAHVLQFNGIIFRCKRHAIRLVFSRVISFGVENTVDVLIGRTRSGPLYARDNFHRSVETRPPLGDVT